MQSTWLAKLFSPSLSFRLRSGSLSLVAALIGTAFLAMPAPAHAELLLATTDDNTTTNTTTTLYYYSNDNGTTWYTTGANPGTSGGTLDTSPITVDGLTIHPTANTSSSTNGALDLTVVGMAAKSNVITIESTVTDVPVISPPESFTWAGFTAQLGGGTTQGWVDPNDYGIPTTSAGGSNVFDTSGNMGSTQLNFSSQYSMTELYSLNTTGNLGLVMVNADLNETVTPVPEPGSLVLAITGVPVFSLGAWLRRRRTQTAT